MGALRLHLLLSAWLERVDMRVAGGVRLVQVTEPDMTFNG